MLCHRGVESRGKASQGKKTIDTHEAPIDASKESEYELARKRTGSERVIKKKVIIFGDDNIIPEPDIALELGNSISLTEAAEEEAARQVHATHARIVTEPVPEPARRRPLGIAFRAAKEEAARQVHATHARIVTEPFPEPARRRPLGVPDESTFVPATLSEGTGTKPGVPDEENIPFEANSEYSKKDDNDENIEWVDTHEEEEKNDDDDDKSIDLEKIDNEKTNDEYVHSEEHVQDDDEETDDEVVHGDEQVNDDEDEEMTNVEVEESRNDDEVITDAAKADPEKTEEVKDDAKKAECPPSGSSSSLRVIELEKEVSKLNQVDHSTEVLTSIKSQVPSVMKANLGLSIDNSFQKDSHIALTAYADADHAGCQDTKRSTFGRVKGVLSFKTLQVYQRRNVAQLQKLKRVLQPSADKLLAVDTMQAIKDRTVDKPEVLNKVQGTSTTNITLFWGDEDESNQSEDTKLNIGEEKEVEWTNSDDDNVADDDNDHDDRNIDIQNTDDDKEETESNEEKADYKIHVHNDMDEEMYDDETIKTWNKKVEMIVAAEADVEKTAEEKELEKEISMLKQVDHSVEVLSFIQSQVPLVVKACLGTSLRDSLQKVLRSHTEKLKKELSEKKDYKDVIKESVQANVINEFKNFVPKLLPKALKKNILYNKINESQSHLTHVTHQELYEVLTWPMKLDENNATRGRNLDTVFKKRDRKDDQDEDPSARPNQGKKTKRKRTKESESSKKASTTKETS
nr:hypothetical protein [Tanacetum cinerariifolium]